MTHLSTCRIERNRQRMIALGIPAAVTALEKLAPAAK